MNFRSFFITSFFLGASLFSFSQHTYSFQVKSLQNNEPEKVLEDFSQHIEEYDKRFEEGVFYFESKTIYTKENFREVAAATGYTIHEFKITSKKKDEQVKGK